MPPRIAVDLGGTFSDLIAYDDESGTVHVAKAVRDAGAPDAGVSDLTARAVPAETVRRASHFLHGTTIALNALLERRGAVVGCLMTQGFRDILELRRGDRQAINDIDWRPAPPLVPRRLCREVAGRIAYDGSVIAPLAERDVASAYDLFREAAVTSIAIVFINSYANGVHEEQAAEVLRRLGFRGHIALSHRVSGEFREYERASTTVIDAYIRPNMTEYVHRLDAALRAKSFAGQILLTRSGGGSMTVAEAEEHPVQTIQSGPVAGVAAAAALCRQLGIERAIGADVGGTSFDTSLIVNGEPHLKYEGTVIGLPVQTPWIDVRSIGAGGGSVAYLDAVGSLCVGPRSAGADPGPACYGRGGTEPTVTDAAAVLGMMAFGELASGLVLDLARARAALRPLADRLGLEIDALGQGILRIMTTRMAEAVRSITVEQGVDPRTAHLVAFGGAGPLFGCLLARELDLAGIVVPRYAGNFSAWGLLGQDVTRSLSATSVRPLDAAGLPAVGDLVASLHRRLSEGTAGTDGDHPARSAALDVRYRGQEYTLSVPLVLDGDRLADEADAVRARFERAYRLTFGHTLEAPLEVVTVRAESRVSLPRLPAAVDDGGIRSGPARTIAALSFERGGRVEFDVIDRAALRPGAARRGPLIICETTTTTYVDAGYRVEVGEAGELRLARD